MLTWIRGLLLGSMPKSSRRHAPRRLGVHLGVENLESRLTPSRYVDIASASIRSPYAEQDGIQEKFYAAESSNGQATRVDAMGTVIRWSAIRPTYDTGGNVIPSPDPAGFPPNPNPPSPDDMDQKAATFTSADGSVILVAWRKQVSRGPLMEVVVGGQTVLAQRVELYGQLTPTHAPSGVNIYSDSSLRTKFLDPTPNSTTKYTGSLFVGPQTPSPDDLPLAPIQRLEFDPAGRTFDLTYQSGGTSRITVTEFNTERTTLEIQVGYHTDATKPFAQYTSMFKSTATTMSAEISDVQVIATHNSTGGYTLKNVFDFTGAVADSVYLFRNQRPDRDTLSGPDHVLTVGTAPIMFRGGRVEDFVGFSQRQNAQHETAAVIGSSPATTVTVAESGYYRVAATFAHDNPTPHQLTVSLNNRSFQYPLPDTGPLVDSGFGWDQWFSTDYGTTPLWLDAGVAYTVTTSATGQAEVDTLVLTRVFASAPVVVGPASVNVPLGGTVQFANGSQYAIRDEDGADGLETVTLSVTTGTLTMNTGGLTVVSGASGTTGLTVRGPLSTLNAALATLQYTAPSSGTTAILSAAPHDGSFGGITFHTTITFTNGAPPPAPLYVDFGTAYGLYQWTAAAGYTQLSTVSPEALTVGADGTLFVDFGPTYGLYGWTAATGYILLNTISPDAITAGPDGYLYIDYGSYGLYRWSSATGFIQLNTVNPEDITIGADASLYVDFGPTYGLYRWTAARGYTQLSTVSPEALTVSPNGTLFVDFGPAYGLYGWTAATGYIQISTVSPETLTVGADGTLFVDFGPAYGLYGWTAATGYIQISTVSPDGLAVSADGYLYIDFGSYGLYRWSSVTGFLPLHTVNPSKIATKRF